MGWTTFSPALFLRSQQKRFFSSYTVYSSFINAHFHIFVTFLVFPVTNVVSDFQHFLPLFSHHSDFKFSINDVLS